MGKSNIEWTDMVWNPVTGCTKVSPGCQNCYAERMAMRFTGHFNVTCHPDRLDQPLHWKKPRRIFVCSMGDLFHEDVPDEFIASVFNVAERVGVAPAGGDKVYKYQFDQNGMWKPSTFLFLTKRPERMLDAWNRFLSEFSAEGIAANTDHIWLGVSVENDKHLWRIHELLKIPAAKRVVSMEPLLGPIYLGQAGAVEMYRPGYKEGEAVNLSEDPDFPQLKAKGLIDWIILGAESGPKRRECKLEWVRMILAQCKAAGIPVFIKQLHINGKLSKNPDEWPEDLRVREYPT